MVYPCFKLSLITRFFLYVFFLFFPPENSLSCFLPFVIELLITFINLFELYVLRKSALLSVMLQTFSPSLSFKFM